MLSGMQEKRKNSLVKSGALLSVITLCSRLMGLVREMTKAAFLGTSAYADAFGIAFMVPNLFRRLFAENSISVAFIPAFRGYLEDDRDAGTHKTAQEFVSATLTLVSFLTAAVTAAGILAAPLIIRLFYRGGTDEVLLAETAFLTRMMFPYLFVISVAAFFQGILNGCGIFAPSGFTPVLFNAIVVAMTYALTPYLANPAGLPKEALAARAMAFGVVTGGCFQALFQWPFVRRTGWKTTLTGLRSAFSNSGTRRVVALIVPTIVGTAAYQLNDLVSTALAGRAGEGVVASLQYSLRLQELILGIFAVSVGTVILPDLSGLAKKKRWQEFNSTMTQAVRLIALITIPVTFYSLVFGRELISLIYSGRSFDGNSVAMTLNVFRFHIAGLFFIAVNRILAPAFYAQGNTRLPTLAGIVCFAVNILAALILVRPMGGRGIALALSAAGLVNTACLFAFMRRMPGIDAKALAKDMAVYALRITAFSVTAAAPVYLLRPALLSAFSGGNKLVSQGMPVLISAMIFAAAGILLLAVFRDETAAHVFSRLKGRRAEKHDADARRGQ